MIDEEMQKISREKLDKIAESFFPNLSEKMLVETAIQFEKTL